MTKFYIDSSSNYIGGFDGALPPDGSTEVPFPPKDARFTWDGSNWNEPLALKDVLVDEKREIQVIKDGISLEDKVNALWDKANGDNTAFDAIDLIVKKAETDFPK